MDRRMIEGLVEEETKPKYEDEKNGEYCSTKYHSTTKYLVRPSGYQFVDENGNVINAQKIVLEKKKKEYPKTYEECEKILGLEGSMIEGCLGYEYKLLNVFQKLLMCRNAYWKLYGEEMGLGKPWEPDYIDKENTEYSYYIFYDGNNFQKGFGYSNIIHRILMFPLEEMRDAFYENFKELIESCKELL